MSSSGETIEDYCDTIETRADSILNDAESYSDEIVAQAREFRDMAGDLRYEAERANEKYFELRDRYDESIEEIEECYDALERLATIQEQHQQTIQRVTDENTETRRTVWKAIAASVATLGAGGIIHHYLTGSGAAGTEAEIEDLDALGAYLSGPVSENPALEQEWRALLKNYDSEEGEFFPGEDIGLDSVDIVLDDKPGEDSGYRVNMDHEGTIVLDDWNWFEHDETAEHALRYFGEI